MHNQLYNFMQLIIHVMLYSTVVYITYLTVASIYSICIRCIQLLPNFTQFVLNCCITLFNYCITLIHVTALFNCCIPLIYSTVVCINLFTCFIYKFIQFVFNCCITLLNFYRLYSTVA